MHYNALDTPSLLIDRDIMMANAKKMQAYADRSGVALRPHTKTHKMSRVAKIQESLGARGITVAKVGEAEVMAQNGLKDIFIANEIVGETKLRRVKQLARTIEISFGLDSIEAAQMIETEFADSERPATVLIEIEVGENRSGIVEEQDFLALLEHLKTCGHIRLKGLFSHDGHSYGAADLDACREIHLEAQRRTLHFAQIAGDQGFELETISIGSTPSLLFDFPILDGVTEIRPGTYIFMDASMASVVGNLDQNAATVLTTVISRPTPERVITDVGAKGLTAQRRTVGITATEGYGLVKEWPGVQVHGVYDEHAIFYDPELREGVRIGDKLRIIPNHICPVVNLYEHAYLIEGDQVVERLTVDGRGQLR
jgi:D-serine deaminase-like pyridoxal phosphate-dependent protein